MRRLLVPVPVLAAVLAAAPAAAQPPRGERPERPYRGLFASGVRSDAEQSLTVRGSLGGGYDDNLVADARGGDGRSRLSDLNTSIAGAATQFAGSLNYSFSRPRAGFNATAATSGRYYPSLDSSVLRRDSVFGQGSANPTDWLSLQGSASYGPYSLSSLLEQSGVLAEAVPLTDPDFVLSDEHFLGYGGGVGVQRKLSARTELSANYDYRARSSSNDSREFWRQSIGGRLSHNLTRGLALRAGYRFVDAHYQELRSTVNSHLIDAGVDYNKALSFSRRTTLAFGTGTSATTAPEDPSQRTRFRLEGSLGLTHEMGRTWAAQLTVARGVRLSESWPEPIVSNVASAGLGGLISRRLQFQLSASASAGQMGFRENGDVESYGGASALEYALSRYVSMGLRYTYYHHRFGQGAILLPGLPGQLDRHSVRASVSVWAPLFQKSRTVDATR